MSARRLGAFSKSNWNPACLNCSFPDSHSLFAGFWWNPAITKCHGTQKILGYRLYSGVFAIAKQSGPRGSLGRRKGRAWRNALMLPIHPYSYFKIFFKLYEHDIERARYCPQHRESVKMKTFDTRMVSQNGSIKGMSLGSAASPPPPLSPPGHRFSFLTLFFALFPHCGASSRLSKFGQSQIEKIFWMNDNALYGCIWIMNNNIKWI